MNTLKKIYSFIPKYARKPLLFLLAFNMMAYCLPAFLPVEAKFDLTLPIDRIIPAVPVFSYIYIISYAYWVFNYILICRNSENMCKRFVTAEVMGKAVCFLFFIFLPCTFDRPSADTLTGIGAWLNKLIFLADEPTRLIPSIHCYASWMCVRPLFEKDFSYIPAWYKVFSFVFTILICLSTLFTRQHVIVDCFAGLALGEIVWLITGKLTKKTTKKEVHER